jgi:hypothetical protein
MTGNAILVTQLATRRHPLRDQYITAVTAPRTIVARVDVRPPVQEELDEFDENYPWAEAASMQREQFAQVLSALEAWPDAEILYMGFAPVPLAIHLGSLFGQTADVSIFQYHRHDKSWRWPSAERTPLQMAPITAPSADARSERDVLLRVAVSYSISGEDTRWIAGESNHVFDLGLAAPRLDAIRSSADLDAFARSFGELLDDVNRKLPNASMRHLVASVPVGVAFAMGMQVNPTVHFPIQTWKYLRARRQRYVRALCLGEFIDLPRVLLLGASPLDSHAISAAAEVEEIGEMLAKHERRLTVVRRPAACVDSLTVLLEEINPTVLHIACHGDLDLQEAGGMLRLTTPNGWSCVVGTDDLLRLLRRASRLCCLVMTACESDRLAARIAEYVPTVVGWTGSLDDQDGRKFSRAFWSSLVRGHSVGEAFRDAQMVVMDRERVKLEPRSDIDPDQVVPFSPVGP